MKSQSVSTQSSDLYALNAPSNFWLCLPNPSPDLWHEAVRRALPCLQLPAHVCDEGDILAQTLGEERFGVDHWQLGVYKRVYYHLKPLIPRRIIQWMRKVYSRREDAVVQPHWPVDERFVRFQWQVLKEVMLLAGVGSVQYRALWPDMKSFGLVLTHDIETATGQAFAAKIADLEESLGFRSSFNFVLERYTLDQGLMDDLRLRGFEVGCHGLKHDGKLYSSRSEFDKRSARINALMKQHDMVGFRSPLTHRNPGWMQALEMEYDLSFFDTDPFESIAGGSMTIWPFTIGHFAELPYTLVQDHSLTMIMNETTPDIWLKKVEFLCRYHGLCLLNSHPDYLLEARTLKVYTEFLQNLQDRRDYWHALPRETARWWRLRMQADVAPLCTASLADVEFAI